MNYEVTGKLIYKEATQKISDRFQKREFVIEVENEKNPQWNDFVKVQLIQDRCDLLETIQLNENIKVYFNLRTDILLAEIGHYESEQYTKEIFYTIIRDLFPAVEVQPSKVNTNQFWSSNTRKSLVLH